LDALAATVRSCGKLNVTIEGHTDATGQVLYNQSLSERRAENVANYLITGGAATEQISYVGYGEMRPKASNRTRAGRARNRRIEYRVE
ncbi:MAG: OmpA family protein, partial [Hyphomicrobiaceae bacterium]